MRPSAATSAQARQIVGEIVDPELPMVSLVDLGVVRDLVVDADGTVVVAITPTYSGCPAVANMRDDLVRELERAGFRARVRVQLHPAWTTDWITARGRSALAAAGISPPARGGRGAGGRVPLTLTPTRRALTCPQCGSGDTRLISEFSSTACTALYRCAACREPFDHVKEI